MNAPEQFAHSSKAAAEALIQVAQSHLATMERLAALNFAASKVALEDGIKYGRAALGARNAQELLTLNAAAAQPSIEKAQAYMCGVYEVLAQSQSQLTNLVEAQASDLNKRFESMLDQYSKSTPTNSGVAVAAIKSAFAAANAAFAAYSKVAKRTTELTQAQLAAYDAYSKVAKQTTKLAQAQFDTARDGAKEVHKKAA